VGKFLEAEKPKQEKFKAPSNSISADARGDGVYRGKSRPFCIPADYAEENLFPAVRQQAMDYFAAANIKWHDEMDAKPSNLLCSSQVQCVNFLFPFADKPDTLLWLLKPHFPKIESLVPMESSGGFVSFEWIGLRNYLGERVRNENTRTRGANFTSSDAAVMFVRSDGLRQIVLIEWKYTEAYSRSSFKTSKSGTSRVEIYRHLLEREDCPLDVQRLSNLEDLFYEPFYQLTRQQLLAHEMERAHELGADLVTTLHVAPAVNTDFQRVTSPNLSKFGDSVTEIWQRLLNPTDKFKSLSTEQLLGRPPGEYSNGLGDRWSYVTQRYCWLTQ
jgi:hypothetical protein